MLDLRHGPHQLTGTINRRSRVLGSHQVRRFVRDASVIRGG
jgi:hypothetical protein